MARKAKSPVVLETPVQDELSAAMAAFVSSPTEDGSVLVEVEPVTITESIVEVPDALGEFGPTIASDSVVEIAEIAAREIHGSYKKVMRPIWNARPKPGMLRRETSDGEMVVIKSHTKYLDSIWFGLADKAQRDDPCPFYVAIRSDGFWDLMLEE